MFRCCCEPGLTITRAGSSWAWFQVMRPNAYCWWTVPSLFQGSNYFMHYCCSGHRRENWGIRNRLQPLRTTTLCGGWRLPRSPLHQPRTSAVITLGLFPWGKLPLPARPCGGQKTPGRRKPLTPYPGELLCLEVALWFHSLLGTTIPFFPSAVKVETKLSGPVEAEPPYAYLAFTRSANSSGVVLLTSAKKGSPQGQKEAP